ncbi:MAG: hypothetical protein KatS3mg102_1868 [Planctomycetota bacterium]|nr:MAG: hypothetical protein KatS3mg102_1868 [Planctomycetota bacterium]
MAARSLGVSCVSAVLFALKRRAGTALPAALLVAAAALGAIQLLALPASLRFHPQLLRDAAAGLGLVLASDALVHGLLLGLGRGRYRARFRAFAEYFAGQRAAAVLGGALLASAEELLFRGVVLEGLRSGAGLGTGPALLLAALAFGGAHALPRSQLAPFAVWAVWEGVLLGAIYVASGSLFCAMAVHAVHDLGGFVVLAAVRGRAAGPAAGAAAGGPAPG